MDSNVLKIIAVIVVYNPDLELLVNQYANLVKQVDGIVYIVNHSWIDHFPISENFKIDIIFNSVNLGLGKAQNQGIEMALSKGATHVLLLDQDSELCDITVSDLLDTERVCERSGEKVGAVAPGIQDAYDREKTVKGIKICGFRCSAIPIGDLPLEVAYCIASGTLIRREVIEDVGLINDKFFIDFLDLEWCMRAKSKGYKIFLSPKARLLHRLGNGEKDRISSHSPMREYYICRNGLLLLKLKYIPLGFRIRRCILIPFRVLISLMTGRIEYFKNGLKGICDALLKGFK